MLKGYALIFCLGAASAVASLAHGGELVYIGTHGSAQGESGSEQGIYAARLDEASGHLTSLGLIVPLQRATWLVTHPKLPVIYSVADSGAGMEADSNIYSLGVDTSSGLLHVINKVDAGGRDATDMDLDVRSMTLFSANHGSGDVSALEVRPDGSLGAVTSDQKDFGSGPNRRQKSPAAHGVAVDPTHQYVLVADFGADRIFIYHFDAKRRSLTPTQPPFESLPAGSGPRHLLFHPSGRFVFVDTELSAELRSYMWNPTRGTLKLLQSVSAYPADYSGEKSAAEIAVTRDGRYLYLSLRGDQNSIVVYDIDKRAGTVKEIQRIASQGSNPWSFGIDPTGRWLLVTNEASSTVNVLKIDRASGKLSATGQSLTVPKPVTVVFYPH
jgi:6-phosphogluconolactonase